MSMIPASPSCTAHSHRILSVVVVAMAVLTACSAEQTAPVVEKEETAAVTAVVSCTGSAAGVLCDAADLRGGAAPVFDRVLGGQNTYVKLAAVSNSFDGGTLRLSSNVTVRNLTEQALGTTDGVNLDPDGVRVFFHTAPTNGVTIVNADGSSTFTGSNQPFFKYNEVIPANATNANAKTWTFQLPSSGTTFTFQVYVTANQPNEPAPVVINPHTFNSLASGGLATHNCAIRTGGTLYCWGESNVGQVGVNLDNSNVTTPRGVLVTVPLVKIARGQSYSCGLSSAGAVYCWGANYYGELGNANYYSVVTVPEASSMPSGVTFTEIVGGAYTTCALTGAGRSYCWGYGQYGQLGNGLTPTNQPTPTPSTMPTGVAFRSIAAGGSHNCAVSTVNTLYCWGYGGNGEIGDGAFTTRNVPTLVPAPAGVAFTGVAATGNSTCAVGDDGKIYCWGPNYNGTVGDNTETPRGSPTQVVMPSGVSFTTVAGGNSFYCALTTTGAAYCWGLNNNGQLGDSGASSKRLVPYPVTMPSGVTFTSLMLGASNSCALSSTGVAYCWGMNVYGAVGTGVNISQYYEPTPVAMP